MGPTNVALVKLYEADRALREAQGRLEAATRNVRIQERRVNDHAEKLRLEQHTLKEQQSHAATMELELKSRDEHIEKLRQQQQGAKTNREYQAFLVEINTRKVDRNKLEDETMKVLESVERGLTESHAMSQLLEAEQAKLTTMKQAIHETISKLQAEIDALRPAREQAAAAVSAGVLEIFDRLGERYDGESMGPLSKPHRRREEYICGGCHMSLVVDIYNRLHSRDELIYCPSCGRILYIPEDLPPETAIHRKKEKKEKVERPEDAETESETESETAVEAAGSESAAAPAEQPPAE